jgi:hypothetical protein
MLLWYTMVLKPVELAGTTEPTDLPAKPFKPLPLPAKTHTHDHGYRFSRVWVWVGLE